MSERADNQTDGSTSPSPPPHFAVYKRTPTFDQDTVPAGLLRSHRTKAGVWARIVVEEGRLLYRAFEPELHEVMLTPGVVSFAAPEQVHEVTPDGPVRFYIEFLRAP